MMSAIPVPTRRQALEQARRSPGFRGICAQCGCTEHNACMLETFDGLEPCWWANAEETLCSNRDCLEKAARA